MKIDEYALLYLYYVSWPSELITIVVFSPYSSSLNTQQHLIALIKKYVKHSVNIGVCYLVLTMHEGYYLCFENDNKMKQKYVERQASVVHNNIWRYTGVPLFNDFTVFSCGWFISYIAMKRYGYKYVCTNIVKPVSIFMIINTAMQPLFYTQRNCR